jgi:DNA polymerase sigma
MNENGLTQEQIEEQDFVDNAIYHFIQSLNPSDKEIPWDIEMMGDVRDVLKEWFVDRMHLIEEQDFYPYME